ncbi:hypothetical protein ACN47E_005889 [Coniothyrium glycines]
MSPTKRQKLGLRDSGVFLDSDSDDTTASSPRLYNTSRSAFSETSGNDRAKRASPPKKQRKVSKHNSEDNDKTTFTASPTKNGNPLDTDSYTYICIHRPFFDVDGENWLQWTTTSTSRLSKSELYEKVYRPGFERETRARITSPRERAEQHPEHKWVMMRGAYLRYEELKRKVRYSDSDSFEVLPQSDWQGCAMQEVLQNTYMDFDRAFRSNDDTRVKEMWTIVSALGLWLNCDNNIASLIDTHDAARTSTMAMLLGHALLTCLHAFDLAGDLTPASQYRDLALVVAYYLELSHDLPAYGVEAPCIAWASHAAAYFKKGNLDPSKGVFATDVRIAKLERALAGSGLALAGLDAVERNAQPRCVVEQSGGRAKTSLPACSDPKKRKREDTVQDKWHWDALFTTWKRENW